MDNKDIEEQKKTQEEINKLLREEEKTRKRLDKLADDRRKNVKKDYQGAKNASSTLNSILKDLNDHTQNLYATTSDYFRAWVSFKSFTSISGMVRDLVSSNNQFHRLIVNAGSANISLANASKEVNKLQQGLGASFEDAQNVVGTLASKQYVGNLGEAAQGAYSFARSTGLATDSVASLTVEFQKTGKLSSSAINSIYADMLKVQQSNGMTKEGMQTTANQIIKMTGNMRAFGKTEQEIRKMAAGTTQLVSSLEKVGISAQTATAWIDKLTDPERIEENIGLYSQLGISISDALSGNIDETQMQNGLKDFGEKVKSMGPIAGAAYAKAFGMTFNNVVKASDMEGAVEKQLTPQEKALDAIKELTENTKTQSEKMTDYVNKLTGRLMNLGPVMLTIGGILVSMLGSSLRRTISNSISEGSRSGLKDTEDETKVTANNITEFFLASSKTVKEAEKGITGIINDNNKAKEELAKKEKLNANDILNNLNKQREEFKKAADEEISNIQRKETADLASLRSKQLALSKIEEINKKTGKINIGDIEKQKKKLVNGFKDVSDNVLKSSAAGLTVIEKSIGNINDKFENFKKNTSSKLIIPNSSANLPAKDIITASNINNANKSIKELKENINSVQADSEITINFKESNKQKYFKTLQDELNKAKDSVDKISEKDLLNDKSKDALRKYKEELQKIEDSVDEMSEKNISILNIDEIDKAANKLKDAQTEIVNAAKEERKVVVDNLEEQLMAYKKQGAELTGQKNTQEQILGEISIQKTIQQQMQEVARKSKEEQQEAYKKLGEKLKMAEDVAAESLKNAAKENITRKETAEEMKKAYMDEVANYKERAALIRGQAEVTQNAINKSYKELQEKQMELSSLTISGASAEELEAATNELNKIKNRLTSEEEAAKELNQAAQKLKSDYDDLKDKALGTLKFTKETYRELGITEKEAINAGLYFSKDGTKFGERAAEKFKEKIKGVGTKIAQGFKGIGKGIDDAFSGFFGRVGNIFKTAGGFVKNSLGAVKGFATGLFKRKPKEEENKSKEKKDGGFGKLALIGGVLISLLGPIIAALKSQESVQHFLKAVQDELGKLANELGPVIDALVPVGEKLLGVLVTVLGSVFGTLIEAISTLTPVINTVTEVLEILFESLGKILVALLPVIANVLNVLVVPLKLIGVLLQFVTPVIEFLCKVLEVLTKPIVALANLLTKDKTNENIKALDKNTKALEEKPEGEKIFVGQNGEAMTSGLSGKIKNNSDYSAETTTTKTTGANASNTTTSTSMSANSSNYNGIIMGIDGLNSKISTLINAINRMQYPKAEEIGTQFGNKLDNFGKNYIATLKDNGSKKLSTERPINIDTSGEVTASDS